MASFKEIKSRLKEATEVKQFSICKSEKDKILLDLNGDGEADAALIDTTMSGKPDLLAVDLTGDHKFNLYIDDTDNNNYPDVIYVDKEGNGNVQLVSEGETVRNENHQKLVRIYGTLTDDESDLQTLHAAMRELWDVIQDIKAKKEN